MPASHLLFFLARICLIVTDIPLPIQSPHTRTLIDRLQYYSIIIEESTTTATSATTTKGLLFYYSKPSDPNKSQAEAGEADERDSQHTSSLIIYSFILSFQQCLLLIR